MGTNESIMNLISRILAVCLGGVALALSGTALAATSDVTNSESAYLADLFASRTVLRIQIEIPPAGMRDLSRHDWDSHHPPNALATVNEGEHVYMEQMFCTGTMRLITGLSQLRCWEFSPAAYVPPKPNPARRNLNSAFGFD
jgi:hypothetical protein